MLTYLQAEKGQAEFIGANIAAWDAVAIPIE